MINNKIILKLIIALIFLVFIFNLTSPFFVFATETQRQSTVDEAAIKEEIQKEVDSAEKVKQSQEIMDANSKASVSGSGTSDLKKNPGFNPVDDVTPSASLVNDITNEGGDTSSDKPEKKSNGSAGADIVLTFIAGMLEKGIFATQVLLTSIAQSDYDTDIQNKLINAANEGYKKSGGKGDYTVWGGLVNVAEMFTLDKLFFGNIKMFDANIFRLDNNNTSKGKTVNEAFKSGLSQWGSVIRYLALMIALATFIMAIIIYISRVSTKAGFEATSRIKDLITDVIFGIVIATLFPVLLAFILYVNDFFMLVLNSIRFALLESGFQNFEHKIFDVVFNITRNTNENQGIFKNFFIAIIGGSVLTVMHIRFALIFFDRFMTIAFLTLMSPVIAVTFAIDRAIDGKSQILNSFLKEYINTVLLEPIYALLYLLFMISVGAIAVTQPILGLFVLAIFPRMESMVKSIFGLSGLKTVRQTKSII